LNTTQAEQYFLISSMQLWQEIENEKMNALLKGG
jgi:hypothetical protein